MFLILIILLSDYLFCFYNIVGPRCHMIMLVTSVAGIVNPAVVIA